MNKRFLISLLVLVAIAVFTTTAVAAPATPPVVVYDNNPNVLPGDLWSMGPEAYAFSELGDGVQLMTTSGNITQVSAIMVSWACQKLGTSGTLKGLCATAGAPTFSQNITLNIYAVDDSKWPPKPGALIQSVTETFNIPYRPAANPTKCPFQYGNWPWYSATYDQCYIGKSSRITFSGLSIPVPAGSGKVIITLTYNTTHYGPAPIGESAKCYGSTVGCPYDSLNIGVSSSFVTPAWPKPDTKYTYIGQYLDTNGIFINWTSPANSCSGSAPTSVLADDNGPSRTNAVCWVGQHPNFEVWATGPTTE